ncbi:uncharacterized protein LOC111297652 [Durio zibethinus]|uniref:Uncharacterized protein LOC111297652 n=1 Tax=Durio zibethinus TaxID=66656 RepID=A0A6P5Z5P3_DURZI|nr:uncharacterized protein LOC111297652 [Durio zibethinus]
MEAHNICSSAIVGEVLKGQENYANWRVCIRNYLWVRDLWDVVEETSEPPKQEEIGDEAHLKTWWKRNVSALHAIQISCAPNMLSYIVDMTTANDAWKTLAQKCQQPPMPAEDAITPMPAEDALTQPVAVVVERTHTLELVKSISRSDLENTFRLLKENPHLVNAKIFVNTERKPLHFAVTVGNLVMVDELLRYMSEEDVKIQDHWGRTALHFAAMSPGNTMIAESLIRKNEELLTIPDNEVGVIPLVLACQRGHKDIAHYLYNETTPAYLLSPENQTQAVSFLCWCVDSKLFDVALDMLRRCPRLAFAKTNNQWNAVLALSRQHSAFLSSSGLSFWQRMIYSRLKVKRSEVLSSDDNVRINTHQQQDQKETKNFMMQGIKQIYDLKQTHFYAHELLLLISNSISALNVEEIHQSSVVEAIINAAQRGMTEFIVEIIKTNPDLLGSVDKDNRTIFHIAVAYRQEKLFSLIYGLEALKYDFPNYRDNYCNNILHLAGQLEPQSQLKLDQISGAALQMQRELQWFKEVESIVPPAFKERENGNGKTPYEVFDQIHANLVKKGEQWMKDIAQSSTIVGTLIITITFAALFTVPGGNNQDTGIPILLTKKLFKLFIILDAVSLFSSSTSVLVFVGILTSRYSKDDFLTSLPTKLIIGLLALFISIATMMVAFCSTVIIMLKGQLELVIPIVLLAAIPICLFVWLQFPLLWTVSISTYGPGIFDRKVKKWF